MSSARTVTARQRRTADTAPQPVRGPQQSIQSQQIFAQQQQQQQQQQQRASYAQYQQAQAQAQGQAQPQYSNKKQVPQNFGNAQNENTPKPISSLTVPQAITLITIRLGRLEGELSRIQNEGVPISAENLEGDENLRLIDETVLNSILTRLQTLENSLSSDAGNNSSHNQSLVDALNDKVASLQNELREAKDAISKLQLFTIDTNQKLLNVVLQQTVPVNTASTTSLADVDVLVEDVDEELEADDNVEVYDNSNPTANLKELIQKELENEDQ
jgi:hypothetical protein